MKVKYLFWIFFLLIWVESSGQIVMRSYTVSQISGTTSGGTFTQQQVAGTGQVLAKTSGGSFETNLGSFSPLSTPERVADSLALVDLYNATNGTEWFRQSNWLTAPIDTWEGIVVSGDRVIDIRLDQNNLNGTLPSSFASLDGLINLNFNINPGLEGEIFNFLASFPNLQIAYGHDCNFTGGINPSVFSNSNLRILVFFTNPNLGGEIPSEVGNAIALEEFELASCGLTGEIPAELFQLPNMISINLENNQLTGNIPTDMSAMINLNRLLLPFNQLTGTIPAEFGDLPSLVVLHLFNNNLEGGIPENLGNSSSLEYILLNENNLGGEVPANFASMTQLRAFDCYRCELTGTIPDLLHLPQFEILGVGGNPNLFVPIPEDIGTLSQLRIFNIWQTRPNRGPFPEDFFLLTELTDLDLSEQQFTGSLGAGIGNMTSLRTLWLRNNQLEGAVPEEILNLRELRTLQIPQNFFTSIPEALLDSLNQLESLNISNNRLNFSTLIALKDAPIPTLNLTPQRARGNPLLIETTVPRGSTLSLASDIDGDGTTYTWAKNGQIIDGATNETLSIDIEKLQDLGDYSCRGNNPEFPGVNIFSVTYRVREDRNDSRSFYVSKDPEDLPDFSSLLAAVNATVDGDTLYVQGADADYDTFTLLSTRILIGPGYFLDENDLRLNKRSANIPTMAISNTSVGNASNTQVYGLSIGTLFIQNNTVVTDTLKNIRIEGNKIGRLAILGTTQGADIISNFIDSLGIAGQSQFQNYYEGFRIENNIIGKLQPNNLVSVFNPIYAEGTEFFFFNRNTVKTIAPAFDNFRLENTLYETNEGNINFITSQQSDFSTVLTNSSGTFNIDSDFQPNDTDLIFGAFSGVRPYRLGGLPEVPYITSLEQLEGYDLNVMANGYEPNNIQTIQLNFVKDGVNVSSQNFPITPAGTQIDQTFVPNVRVLQAGESYEALIQVRDNAGRLSLRDRIGFFVEAASVSGVAKRSNGDPVNNGILTLMEIKPVGTSYDTIAQINLEGNNAFVFENLFLSDYIISLDPDSITYPLALQTYFPDAVYWDDADTLFVRGTLENQDITVFFLGTEDPGNRVITGILEEELQINNRVIERTRVSNARVTVRRSTSTSKGSETAENFVLVGERFTDANGQFNFSDLPPALYRLRFDLPGVPQDESRNVDLDLRENEDAEVVATIIDGRIVVEQIIRLQSPREDMKLLVYPNPSTDILTLRFPEDTEKWTYRIMDIQGKELKSGEWQSNNIGDNEISFEVRSWKKGVYLLQSSNLKTKEMHVIKIIVGN